MTHSLEDIKASLTTFLLDLRQLVASEPDVAIGRVDRHHAGRACYIELGCGKSTATLHWIEELHERDQLHPQYHKTVDSLRQREARRVAENEILMGTMARFYVSE